LGLSRQDVEPCSWHVGKLAPHVWQRGDARARLIAVTAITPTRLGEGKTVTSIGLAQS
jgi:formyltetrahydrofolate synthetase